jgi:hypothetical protein
MNMPAKHAAPGANLTFARRYLDTNRVTYEYHSATSNKTFDTSLGKTVTKGLQKLAKAFDLAHVFGTAPHDYYLNRVPYPDAASALSLLAQNVTPVALAVNNSRASIPHVIIANSGALRFDLYGGPFTRDDAFKVSPFTDAFLYIAGVPAGVAAQVLPLLNKEGSDRRRSFDEDREAEAERYARGWVGGRYNNWLRRMDETEGALKRAAANLTLGYVTKDVRAAPPHPACIRSRALAVVPGRRRRHAARAAAVLQHAGLHRVGAAGRGRHRADRPRLRRLHRGGRAQAAEPGAEREDVRDGRREELLEPAHQRRPERVRADRVELGLPGWCRLHVIMFRVREEFTEMHATLRTEMGRD